METLTILIAGCGDVGTQAALQLSKQHRVFGLKRSSAALATPIHTIIADLNKPETLSQLPAIDIVVYCAAPNLTKNERAHLSPNQKIALYRQTYLQGLDNLLNHIKQPLRHLFFVSSTSVYAQNDHTQINENSTTEPTSATAQLLLQAEQLALSSNTPASIIRFSGIYSATRLSFLRQIQQGKYFSEHNPRYSNRIHATDCAGVICHLVERVVKGQPLAPIYLASDQQPEKIDAVARWLTKELKASPTELITRSTTGSKRCDSSLLTSTGYRFRYPSYKEGYTAIIKELGLSSEKNLR